MASRARSNPGPGSPLSADWRAGSGGRAQDTTGRPVDADAVFEALDGLELEPDSPHVRVYSIFDQDDIRWIQCGLDAGGFMGTLRTTVTDTPERVVRMLRSWLLIGETGTGFDSAFDIVVPPPVVIH